MTADYNILNRASFDDKQLRYTLKVQPFIHEGHGTLDLKGSGNVLWIKQITWQFKYVDVGMRGAVRRQPKPIQVTVADILDNDEAPYPPFTQPKPVVGKVPFRVINTNLDNNHQLVVTFNINGVLVKPKPDAQITLKEMLAYIMMSENSRGELAMAEAVADKMDETFTQLGLGGLRDKLPGGLGALTSLPEPMQRLVLNAMAANGDIQMPALMGQPGMGAAPALALPDADPEKEFSSFLGDIISSMDSEVMRSIPMDALKTLSRTMIDKGWRKL